MISRGYIPEQTERINEYLQVQAICRRLQLKPPPVHDRPPMIEVPSAIRIMCSKHSQLRKMLMLFISSTLSLQITLKYPSLKHKLIIYFLQTTAFRGYVIRPYRSVHSVGGKGRTRSYGRVSVLPYFRLATHPSKGDSIHLKLSLSFSLSQSYSRSLFEDSIKILRDARKAQECGRDRRLVCRLGISPLLNIYPHLFSDYCRPP